MDEVKTIHQTGGKRLVASLWHMVLRPLYPFGHSCELYEASPFQIVNSACAQPILMLFFPEKDSSIKRF